MRKFVLVLCVVVIVYPSAISKIYAQDPQAGFWTMPSKLQLAVEPEEIILKKGITVGAADRKIQMIIRETSGIKNAVLELVARPFIELNNGDIVDLSIVKVELSEQQVALEPGGLQRVEITIGGFKQAGSYLGGITIHDTVSGERKEIAVRVSVKDSWPLPVFVLLGTVLLASGVNHWTKKGRRKNRVDLRVAELRKAITLMGAEYDSFLVEAEQLLEKAETHNQEYQFSQAEAALADVEQTLQRYEQRKQDSEELRQKIEELLHEVGELGESDPQNSKLNGELIRLLPKVQTDYEETEAIFKQLDMFFGAYRMARKDLRIAREKLASNLDYVKKADRSKLELLLSDIDRLLTTAESLSALDEANVLLRRSAFELSPEKINENIFRSQRFQKVLDEYHEQVKHVTGAQVQRIVMAWYDKAQGALEDSRYEDVEGALQKLDKVLAVVDKIKQAEKRVKGRDQKMTELRRIIRECKSYLEGTSWDGIHRAEYDITQVLEILDGVREEYEPFSTAESQRVQEETATSDNSSDDSQTDEPLQAEEPDTSQLRPLSHDDLQRNLERTMDEAGLFPKLRGKILKWRSYCNKLLEFNELNETLEYIKMIQEELVLYARMQAIRAQAIEQHLHAVQRLTEQAEQLLLMDTHEEDRGAYHRAEVLTDAAKALLDEKQNASEFDHVISNIRSPKMATNLVTYGTLASYFVVATALGFQILYAPNPDFGATLFEDYFSLGLWAFGLEGAKMTVSNVYEAYFKKER